MTKQSEIDNQSEADADLVQHAKDLYEIDSRHWDGIYDKGRDDLKFLSDEQGAQWNEKEFQERAKSGRPALTIDYLSQFVHQVANNIRMNTPSINVIPIGNDASMETAEVFKGLIKQIEYTSSADEVYDTAATCAIKGSIGYMRVDHDYVDDTTHDQQLLIKRIINPFLVYPDSTTNESDGRDQNHCTILEKMKVKEFRRLYPDLQPIGFDEVDLDKDHQDDDEIYLAEFFIRGSEERRLDLQDAAGATKSRTIAKNTIMRYKLSGHDVLSRTTFPGEYIPIVPVYGEEAWEDGQRNLFSLIRKAKQAQMMFNVHKSLELEVLMKQPLAPVMVPEGSIENYAEDWKDPSKSMALRYATKDAEGNPLPPPQRLNPPTMPQGFAEGAHEAVDDIKATMGMFNASIGEQGNEISGKAINARKIEGDVATYHYGDNLVRSITQIGRILVCAAPFIYDTQRLVQILNEEDEPETVGLNGAQAPDQQAIHNFSRGKYDVRVVTGASFTTKRQEAAQFFEGVIKQQPQLMGVIGDLVFKYQDFAGAQQMAARIKKTIPPQILAGEDGDKQDPQVAQLTQELQKAQAIIKTMQQQGAQLEQQLKSKDQSEQMGFQLDQAKLQIEQGKLQLDAEKLQLDQAKLQIDSMKAQTDQFKAQSDAQLKGQELQIAATAAQVPQPQPVEAREPAQPASPPVNLVLNGMGQSPEERAQEQQEKAALIQGLQGVIGAVDNLTQAVATPKNVMRDKDGRIVGVQ